MFKPVSIMYYSNDKPSLDIVIVIECHQDCDIVTTVVQQFYYKTEKISQLTTEASSLKYAVKFGL